jgi:hypothetical protein
MKLLRCAALLNPIFAYSPNLQTSLNTLKLQYTAKKWCYQQALTSDTPRIESFDSPTDVKAYTKRAPGYHENTSTGTYIVSDALLCMSPHEVASFIDVLLPYSELIMSIRASKVHDLDKWLQTHDLTPYVTRKKHGVYFIHAFKLCHD